MAQTSPSKRPVRSAGSSAVGLACPSCNGEEFTERSSFRTASEPLLGAVSTGVTVDLMSCKRCGADLPAVRGRRRYTLVGGEKLASILADLEEAKRINSEMEQLIDAMAKRSSSLSIEIERCRAQGEISVMRQRVASLEAETGGMEATRARLAETLELMASRIPAD